MKDNVLTAFKTELGYIAATNQYVELAVRIMEKDYYQNIETDLQGLAKTMNLNVSALSEDYKRRISKSYIVSVYSCFENFLKNFKNLPGSPTNVSNKCKNSESSWLEWTLDIVAPQYEKEIENDIAICEYYRLVRNGIVHCQDSSSAIRAKRSIIRTDLNPRLEAPNEVNLLSFDDQVLFSRAAYNVSMFIFNNSCYDIDAVIESLKGELADLIRPLQEPCSHDRAIQKVNRFINGLYPKYVEVCNWETINGLLA